MESAPLEPMESLANEHCRPVRRENSQVTGKHLLRLHQMVPSWRLIEHTHRTCLQRAFPFHTFFEAREFTQRVCRLAQMEEHFLAILTEWGQVQVTWWTPGLKGIHRNDFIMAAKTDRAYSEETRGTVSIPSPLGARSDRC